MALQELNDKLHSRDFHREPVPASDLDPRVSAENVEAAAAEASTEWRAPVVVEKKTWRSYFAFYHRFDRRKKIAFLAGMVAGLLLIFGLVAKLGGFLFNEENIVVAIEGPSEVPSGEEFSVSIRYHNANWEGIDNAVLIFSYPENFVFAEKEGVTSISQTRAEIPLGDIAARSGGTKELSGTLSETLDLATLSAALRYAPPGLQAEFTKTAQTTIRVTPSLFSLEVAAPREIASGQNVEYIVDYRNTDNEAYSDVRLQMSYPDGFRFLSAEPQSSEGENIWYLGSVMPGASGRVIIRGLLSGSNGETKRATAALGRLENTGAFLAYASRTRETRISASPLSIFQSVNGLSGATVNPGDRLSYSVKFRNDGSAGVRDAIVTVELDSPYLDYTELRLETPGAFSSAAKTITWKASDVALLGELSPGEEGELRFTVPVQKNFSTNPGSGGVSIQSVATIDSPDLPTPIGQNKIIGSNTIVVKVNALITPTIQVFYNDRTFPNSGPLPPVVGEETTYTIHLRLEGSTNTVTGTRALIKLPTSVDYKEKFVPATETLRFNERANELSWELGTLEPRKNRELIFQIGVTPAPSNVGEPVILVNTVSVTGLDSYTKSKIEVTTEKRENNLPDDTEAQGKSNLVQPANE